MDSTKRMYNILNGVVHFKVLGYRQNTVIEHTLKRNNSLSILVEKLSLMLRQLDCCLG